MIDNIIKRLREAIAAGPTRGPWVVGPDTRYVYSSIEVADEYDSWKPVIAVTDDDEPQTDYEANAAYIAAASPDNIAALIDWLDTVERENERLLNKLNALLMLVSKKYPGETRYETACRYIREAGNQEVSGLKHDLTRATKENK